MHKWRASKQRQLPFINLTPLIDVLFILLIFFIVSSTFKRFSTVKLSLPSLNASAKPATATPIEISITQDGNIYIEEASVALDQLPEVVKARLNASSQDQPTPVYLKVDRAAAYGKAMEVIHELQKEEIQTVLAVVERSSAPVQQETKLKESSSPDL